MRMRMWTLYSSVRVYTSVGRHADLAGSVFFCGVEPTPYLVLQNLLFSIKGGSHVQTTNDLDPARQKDFQNISPPRSGDL